MEQKYMPISKNRHIAKDITELIGGTPMIEISKMSSPDDATIYAKLEWFNIGGSVKDRMALHIIEDAEKSGKLKEGKTIIEATSGNTGISYAMIAASKGYKIKIVLSESVSIERRKIIKAYGAELVLSPGDKGTGGAIEIKRKIVAENRDKYVDLDQFSNQANILAHYETTGKEIIDQTGGDVDMIVMGLGTGGTGVGVSKRLKEHNEDIKTVGVIPKLGFSIQGLRNPKDTFPTELHDEKYFDEIVEIQGEEIHDTLKTARDLAKKEGLFVG
ncbi:MAG: PLP-dependent cysteine synthase family protein, partial [Candidatus Aenigmarchaeota archaeon]|nr:PLP-dependent cysteine synthase family protein [Candidatus Aenigmarchaeota archaeon]